MENQEEREFTHEDSLALIANIIQEAKVKFEENGAIYMMWGFLVGFAAIAQYFMLQSADYANISYYPYFLMPLGAIASGIYYGRKKEKPARNNISKGISATWTAISLNIMVLGFFFGGILKSSLIPMILILVGIGTILSGNFLKSNVILGAGILLNIVGFLSFLLDWSVHPLILGIASLLFIFVPGLILMINHKRKKRS